MKKVLLFAAALCLMISAQAQIGTKKSDENSLKSKIRTVEQLNRGTAAYTQKLDSMVMANGMATTVFEYDSHFNTTKIVMSGLGVSIVTEYIYDSQDHRICTMVTNAVGEKSKTEYIYNGQGLVKESTSYEFEEGEWEEDEQTSFEYDNNGNLVLVTTFDYDDGVWVRDEKSELTYQNDKLMSEMVYDWYMEEWVEDSSTEYNYDAQGYLVEIIELDKVGVDWLKDSRIEYTYDDNHNCISQTDYDYDDYDEDWEIESLVNYTYDLSVSSSTIAGLDNLTEAIPSLNNKLSSVEETNYDDGMPQMTMSYNLYYSNVTGMGEHDGSRLAIWPNPTTESLNLNTECMQQVDIFTIDGRQVMHLENGFETINVSALAKGCYLLTATFADGSKAVKKFVKE